MSMLVQRNTPSCVEPLIKWVNSLALGNVYYLVANLPLNPMGQTLDQDNEAKCVCGEIVAYNCVGQGMHITVALTVA